MIHGLPPRHRTLRGFVEDVTFKDTVEFSTRSHSRWRDDA